MIKKIIPEANATTIPEINPSYVLLVFLIVLDPIVRPIKFAVISPKIDIIIDTQMMMGPIG